MVTDRGHRPFGKIDERDTTHAAITPPAAEQESQVPEREWVDLDPTTVDGSAIGPGKTAAQPRAADPSVPLAPHGRASAAQPAAHRPQQPHSAAKAASRPRGSSGVMVGVIVACVVLVLIGLGVLRGVHKRMLARDTVESDQGNREAKPGAVRLPEVNPSSDTTACHLNSPRTWKVTVNKQEDTPFKSLTLVNPSGDMSIAVITRPKDEATVAEIEMASKAAALRADKSILVEDGWLDLPVQRVWREVRNLPAEEPALTEVSYFIRKPAFDVMVRARMPALRFPQFRKFIEDIMQSVYCDEPAKVPVGMP